MEIKIKQRKWSLNSSYKVYQNGKEEFEALRKFYSGTIRLWDKNRIQKAKMSWNLLGGLTSFSVKKLDGRTYKFKTESYWKDHWKLENEKERYDVYEHEGLNFSIYLNEEQVGMCQKNDIVLLGGDQYDIKADYDVDIELIVIIFLLIDNTKFSGRNGLNWNFGKQISSEKKARNFHWQPKRNKI
jgi:hypothetical protein